MTIFLTFIGNSSTHIEALFICTRYYESVFLERHLSHLLWINSWL